MVDSKGCSNPCFDGMRPFENEYRLFAEYTRRWIFFPNFYRLFNLIRSNPKIDPVKGIFFLTFLRKKFFDIFWRIEKKKEKYRDMVYTMDNRSQKKEEFYIHFIPRLKFIVADLIGTKIRLNWILSYSQRHRRASAYNLSLYPSYTPSNNSISLLRQPQALSSLDASS